jgi:hypothetical protein
MQIYRTQSEAVIEASVAEREEIRRWLHSARRGERLVLRAGARSRECVQWSPASELTICIAHGRGFDAYWERQDSLRVDVGENAIGGLAEAFNFPPGAHVHYDPIAFPEEKNDASVELVVQDEATAL